MNMHGSCIFIAPALDNRTNPKPVETPSLSDPNQHGIHKSAAQKGRIDPGSRVSSVLAGTKDGFGGWGLDMVTIIRSNHELKLLKIFIIDHQGSTNVRQNGG